MDYRHNEATINRPQGERDLAANLIFTDLVATVEQLRNEKAYDTNDLNGITVLKNDSVTIVVTLMKKGSVSKRNEVNTGLTLLVLSGSLIVETDGEALQLGPAQMLNLNPLIPHDVTAEEESILVQMTHPG